MKDMIYSMSREREVLYSGTYKGYKFYILNLGIFPTAYIELPKEHKYTNYDDYNDIALDVHGGITYKSNYLYISKKRKIETKGCFIGWDYGHYEDYIGYEERFPKELRNRGKKWTTQEIYEEACDAIDQLEKG